MKAHIIVTDDSGGRFEADVELSQVTRIASSQRKGTRTRRAQGAEAASAVNFDLPDRAFMKNYAGELSGPKKFALLLALVLKGKAGQSARVDDIAKRWNKMKALMRGEFNAAYSTRANRSSSRWSDFQ